MRPSESAVGRDWLSNFHATEVPSATVLLDHLRFVSFSGLWVGLLGLLRGLESVRDATPFVVYPERRLDAFDMRPQPHAGEPPVAWKHFDPGAPLGIPAGSDGFVSMVLKELREQGAVPVGGMSTEAKLSEIRDRRCRSIVLATDIVASGQQIEELAAAIGRNPTIRSWRSFGWVRIRVAAFAAAKSGLDRLAESRYVDTVHYLDLVPTVSSLPLSDEVRSEVIRLCERHRGGEAPLGFGSTGALFATERRAPNNVPGVFTRPDGANWHGLFPGRTIPEAFATEVGDYRGSETLQGVAERVGQLRLGRNERVPSVRPGSRALLQAMTLASAEALHVDALAQSLGTDRSVAGRLMSAMQSWGFLDAAGRLTAAGHRELDEYKRGRRRSTAGLEGSVDPYYHRSLR